MKFSLFASILLFGALQVLAQPNSQYIDSLQNEINVASTDSAEYELLMELGKAYAKIGSENELGIVLQALRIAKEMKDALKIAQAHLQLARYHTAKGELDEALDQCKITEAYFSAPEISDTIRDKHLTTVYNIYASLYRNKGFYTKSIEYAFEVIKLSDQYNLPESKTGAYNNIGIVYSQQRRYDKALIYFTKAYDYFTKTNDEAQAARLSGNLGIIHKNLGNVEQALDHFNETKKFFEKVNNTRALSTIYLNLSILYLSLNLDSSLHYGETAYQLTANDQNSSIRAESAVNYAGLLMQAGNLKLAEELIEDAYQISKTYGYRRIMPEILLSRASLYYSNKKYKAAYDEYRRATLMKDTLNKEANNAAFSELQSNYEAEQRQVQIEQLKQEKALQAAEVDAKQAIIDKQYTQLLAGIGGISLLLFFGVYLAYNIRQKRKANQLLRKQKNEIQEKNKEITDSINYAKRIQEAILPSDDIINKFLPDSFVFYLPKDIVSGDFYWLEAVKDRTLFAAVDCTGHGVPGGFMSIVGHNALHKAAAEDGIDQPSIILDELHQAVSETLQGSVKEVKDGMDISVCSLKKQGNDYELQYSGAINPIYVISNNNLQQVKGDKMAIGSDYKNKPFTNHTLPVQKGDVIYIFSDGFADQFGGEKGKKYKYSQFQELLLSIHQQPMEMQRESIAKEFYKWKGDYDQLDDVLVIGVRV